MENGRAVIVINGEVELPFFYGLTHSFGARYSWEHPKQQILKRFAAAGVRLFQVDIYFEDIWYENEPQLDLEPVQRQLGGIMRACPDAGIVLRIHVNAPFWWNEAHPEECTQYADGPVDFSRKINDWSHESGDTERSLRASLASMVWREEAGARLAELCTRIAQTPEGNSLIGFHVAGGIYGEWHYWGSVAHEPDVGPVMTRHFRDWLTRKYGSDAALQQAWNSKAYVIDTATVPGTDERTATALGCFRDPQAQRRLIDYFTCQMETVADDIEYFCKIVKQTFPRPTITGIFYGYFHMMFNRLSVAGHGCIERILNSPWVDYLSAPQSYWGATRKLGGSGNSRGIIESTILHGKLWLDEVDNGGEQKSTDDPHYLPVVRRSAVVPLMRGQGFWYYDFGIAAGLPGWFGSPQNLRQVKEERQLFDRAMTTPRKSVADVLFVWDYESMYYVANCWTATSYMQLDHGVEHALRSGAAIDEIYLFDLPTVDLSQYRAVVFGNAFCLKPEQRAWIEKQVAKDERTLIYQYMPGITDGNRLSLELVSQQVGMRLRSEKLEGKPRFQWTNPSFTTEFEAAIDPFASIELSDEVQPLAHFEGTTTVVAARAERPSYVLVYSAAPILGSGVWRELFRSAGCHIYSERDDALWANSQHVLVHCADAGQREVKLRNGKHVSVSLDAPKTVVLAADTGKPLLT